MIILINGAPGSGKTKTAEYLFENTDNIAFVDGDWLLAVNPFDRKNEDQRRLRYRNIATVAKNYYDAGYQTVIITFVYPTDELIREQIDLLKQITNVTVVSLVPSDEKLHARHAGDSYKRVDISHAVDLNNQIKSTEAGVKIDNSALTVEETALQITTICDLKKL
jgi:adenylylsulfate kinase-like enzyme